MPGGSETLLAHGIRSTKLDVQMERLPRGFTGEDPLERRFRVLSSGTSQNVDDDSVL